MHQRNVMNKKTRSKYAPFPLLLMFVKSSRGLITSARTRNRGCHTAMEDPHQCPKKG
jgi:hypothetical protein